MRTKACGLHRYLPANPRVGLPLALCHVRRRCHKLTSSKATITSVCLRQVESLRCVHHCHCSQTPLIEEYLSSADSRLTRDADIMADLAMEVASCDAVSKLASRDASPETIENELRPLLRTKLESLPWLRIGIGVFRLQTSNLLTNVAAKIAPTGSAMPFKALVHTTLFVGHYMIEYTTKYASTGSDASLGTRKPCAHPWPHSGVHVVDTLTHSSCKYRGTASATPVTRGLLPDHLELPVSVAQGDFDVWADKLAVCIAGGLLCAARAKGESLDNELPAARAMDYRTPACAVQGADTLACGTYAAPVSL